MRGPSAAGRARASARRNTAPVITTARYPAAPNTAPYWTARGTAGVAGATTSPSAPATLATPASDGQARAQRACPRPAACQHQDDRGRHRGEHDRGGDIAVPLVIHCVAILDGSPVPPN